MKTLEIRSIGSDRGQGNLLGLQLWAEPRFYRDEESFTAFIRESLTAAKSAGLIQPKTIAVLPEYAATWLVAAEEKDAVYRCRTIEGAMIGLILGNWKAFFRAFFTQFPKQKARDRFKYSIFRMKAETAGRIYFNAFSRLAREFGITIVAGSIVLPRFRVRDDQKGIEITGEELYNATLVFRPDGTADPRPYYKVFPTPQELPFTTPGPLENLPVYSTPAGRLGVLNCADSWYGMTYADLKGKIDLLAIPSFVEKNGDLGKPWNGKNITPEPVEFDHADFHKITYDDAWIKYACPARFEKGGVKNVMNVFLRGKFWSLGSDGRSIIIAQGKLERGAPGVGSAIQSLWL